MIFLIEHLCVRVRACERVRTCECVCAYESVRAYERVYVCAYMVRIFAIGNIGLGSDIHD